MLPRCVTCGKVLTKSKGPLGPKCLKKFFPKKYVRRKKAFDHSCDITLSTNKHKGNNKLKTENN